MRDRVAPSWALLTAIALAVAAGGVRAATFTVTTTADSGAGSLRQAIDDAANNFGADRIDFDSGLAGTTIALNSPLPTIHDPVEIDADLNADCAPDVNVSGAAAGTEAFGLTFGNGANGSRVHGLAWHSWTRAAIRVFAGVDGIVIDCNHFGTDTTGAAVLPNGAASAPGVGLTATIELSGSDHTVGPGNLIANSRGPGVWVQEHDNGAYPEFTALVSDAPPRVYPTLEFNDQCGSFEGDGFTPLDGNGAPFTENFGMRLRGRITVGASGEYTFDFPNLDDNARLRLDGVTVAELCCGDPPPVLANLSAGAHTIEIDFFEGRGAARLAAVISGPGSVALSSDDQALCPPGQVGLCAELFQLRVPSEGNTITRNRMRDNADLGIRLGFPGCGQLANDPGDADAGPNTLLNSPVIAEIAALGGGDFTIAGTAAPGSAVELFLAAPDPSGFGEGELFLADANASGGGNFVVVAALPPSGVLTATATDAAGNTSEFGRNLAYTTGASGLFARAEGAGAIRLFWTDPDLGETGFRIERSTNGTTFQSVVTVGPDVVEHLDSGLAANTLYYYRVIATTGTGDTPASNRATASTFPLSAAKVCFQRIPRDDAFALSSALAWDGEAWAMAWSGRSPGRDNIDVFFQRFEAGTLAPLGPPSVISDADMNVLSVPLLVWNGSHYGVLWSESIRNGAGERPHSPVFFAVLDASGQRVVGPLRLDLGERVFHLFELHWDGSHWGVFGLRDGAGDADMFLADIYFTRLNASGGVVVPTRLLAATALDERRFAVAWSPEQSQYGLAFIRGRDGDWQWLFQRFTASGEPVDAEPVVLDAPATFPIGTGALDNVSVTWDGARWAVAYVRGSPDDIDDNAVYLRLVDGASGQPLGGGSTRLSGDAPDFSFQPRILPRAGGGFAVFTTTFGQGFQQQVGLWQADADGARDGDFLFVTPDNGMASIRAQFGASPDTFLVAHGFGTGVPLATEIYGVQLARDGTGAPSLAVALTSGHDPDGARLTRTLRLAAVGAGFVGVWVDGPPAALRLNLRSWDGNGAILSTLTPLTASSTRFGFDLAPFGDSFALVWKNLANELVFARYLASGGAITGEKVLRTGTGGGSNLFLRWNGEHFGVFYQQPDGPRYLRVDADGDVIGEPVPVIGPNNPQTDIAWRGDGWAVVTRQGAPAGSLDYRRLAADGSVLDGPVTLTTPVFQARGARQPSVHFTGRALGLAWLDWAGFDPPSEDIFFTVVERDGSLAFAPRAVVSSPFFEFGAVLAGLDDDFRLLNNNLGSRSGLHETLLDAQGEALGTRFVSNRHSAIGPVRLASNGANFGLLYFPSGLQHLYFHTDACTIDATPPPCPSLSAQREGAEVALDWSPVADPESTVIRYQLYRDGLPLAEFDPDLISFRDAFDAGAAHVYQLRALNGAFVESQSCATVALTLAIFADGFEGMTAR